MLNSPLSVTNHPSANHSDVDPVNPDPDELVRMRVASDSARARFEQCLGRERLRQRRVSRAVQPSHQLFEDFDCGFIVRPLDVDMCLVNPVCSKEQ